MDGFDFSNMSVSTANDEIPLEFLEMDDISTARSIENLTLSPANATDKQFLIGLSTEEDGNVRPFVDSKKPNKLKFSLKNVDLCVKMRHRQSMLQISTEARDSVQYSILAQVRFQVGSGDFNEPMLAVDGDVFCFGPNAEPITIRIADPEILRMGIELRYIQKTKLFDFEIVPRYSIPSSLPDFDSEEKDTIQVIVSGKSFYPDREVMEMHNLNEFGRGDSGEFFPKMTVELRSELTKSDIRTYDMMNALFWFLHPPHQPVQQKFIRPLVIFAAAHRMSYLLHCMENALIMEPPVSTRLLLNHFLFGEKWKLNNLIRISLLRAEGSYIDVAKGMVNLPDYSTTLSLGLRRAIAERMFDGWSAQFRRLGERTPTKNLNRVVYLKEGGIDCQNEENLHTFAEVHSSYAFGEPH